MREPVVMSFNEPTCFDRETLEDELHDSKPSVEDIATRNDGCEKIIGIFEGRDRRIFELLYVDGLTQETVAAIVGVSESCISLIGKKLRETAREHMRDWALDAAS